MKIGFLGLGTMGAPMANNLRKSGHTVTVWNRTPAKAEPLVKKGARQARSPRECAAGQDVVFACLADEKALEAVLAGPDGALEGLRSGDLLVDTSTAGVKEARSVEERVRQRGAHFLAAPLLGSRAAAEKAQLTVVVGGPAQARERARPALKAISARIVELDTASQAALMKLVVNALGGAMMAGFGEALALGASGGLDVAKIVETIQASSFHSPLYLMKGEQILQGDWAPRFAIQLAEKDQRLAQEAAAEQGAKMPINAAVRRLFADAIESGRGDKDLCAVVDLLFDWAGLNKK
ncbi:MAG TPA: NAD(P)-dependent oxidoreductase [Anaeromyxobacteraceae bacterium]|nr:NAD(P)-dependent oxidoreductase [Anaeromyxobacteraceae bacterium]